jgi:hypothetical protein
MLLMIPCSSVRSLKPDPWHFINQKGRDVILNTPSTFKWLASVRIVGLLVIAVALRTWVQMAE